MPLSCTRDLLDVLGPPSDLAPFYFMSIGRYGFWDKVYYFVDPGIALRAKQIMNWLDAACVGKAYFLVTHKDPAFPDIYARIEGLAFENEADAVIVASHMEHHPHSDQYINRWMPPPHDRLGTINLASLCKFIEITGPIPT